MKIKSTWVPFFLSFVAIVSIRLYQILSIGVPAARMQWDNLEMLCFWIAVVASLIIIAISYMSKDVPDIFILRKNLLMGLISFASAIVVNFRCFSELGQVLSSNMDMLGLLRGISGILAGVTFFIIGLCILQEKNIFEKNKLLACLPSFWAAMLLAKLFSEYNSIRTDFIHIADVLGVVCLLFFLFEQARLFVGLFNKETLKKLFFFGFGEVLFTTILITNNLAEAMYSGRHLTSIEIQNLAIQLIMMLYIVSFLCVVRVGSKAEFVENISSVSSSQDHEEPIVTNKTPDPEDNYVSSDMTEVDALIADIQNESV